jgi:hypothetical protein
VIAKSEAERFGCRACQRRRHLGRGRTVVAPTDRPCYGAVQIWSREDLIATALRQRARIFGKDTDLKTTIPVDTTVGIEAIVLWQTLLTIALKELGKGINASPIERFLVCFGTKCVLPDLERASTDFAAAVPPRIVIAAGDRPLDDERDLSFLSIAETTANEIATRKGPTVLVAVEHLGRLLGPVITDSKEH